VSRLGLRITALATDNQSPRFCLKWRNKTLLRSRLKLKLASIVSSELRSSPFSKSLFGATPKKQIIKCRRNIGTRDSHGVYDQVIT
jgi:hypothetical protein